MQVTNPSSSSKSPTSLAYPTAIYSMENGTEDSTKSLLFQPLVIGSGRLKLEHRIIHAPLTRNRGVPLNPISTTDNPNRIWYPGDLMVEYYKQRTTKGGLLISEGIPPSLESNGMPGVPGLFTKEQANGWRKVVHAVHEKGGYIYCQLWHAGRATIPQMTGSPPVSASASVWDSTEEFYSHIPFGETHPIRYAEHPPLELSVTHIKKTINDYCEAAKLAMDVGFDGVELHAGNGYLPEQFLSSNINKRTDEYGGSPEKRCRFVLELMDQLGKTIGDDNLAIRLSPFGLFNQARSEQRVETWGYLCRMLKDAHPTLSYVSFIEPRYEQIFSDEEKHKFLLNWGLADVGLDEYRRIFDGIPFFSAGGWNDTNCWNGIASGKYDGLLFGRYFISNPDLVARLQTGCPLAEYDRSRFYGPFEDNIIGYTDYPPAEQNCV
ncbi:putative 12-oxophytodienoate reductase [Talaromyces proteolyticus]|uniref:12-oxophytodienoate reductase n=1 Tax=Talaromyces proteolyticus TaxID=1131652 RepID=A0AAD4Q3A5_9EURO|nr:putative 12-oxophytodienoate reductase [Talaromyces proteolyticus]KAH8701572.1 putative 12-oxophytodienoate reductase [Talaromyces proteolyticus]